MKRNLSITIFLIGIIISSVVVSPFVLDFTLVGRYITLSIAILILIYLRFKSKDFASIKIDFIVLCYLCYVIFCCCSILWAKNKSEALFESSKIILSFFVFTLVYFSLKKDYKYFFEALLKITLFIFILEFSVLIYQFSLSLSFEKADLYYLTGINGHKNLVSSFLFLNLFFLLLAFLKFVNKWKLLAAICLALNLVTIFILETKAVWLGIAMAVAVYLLILAIRFISNYFKIKINSFIIIILLLFLSNVFFISILPVIIKKGVDYNKEINLDRTQKINTSELDNERLVIWDKTYYVFQKKQFIGVGMGNWQIFYPDATLSGLWRCDELNYTFQRPHNDFLWILSETGLIGFNLFMLFLISMVVFISKINIESIHQLVNLEILLSAIFIIGFFSISFFDFPKERMEHLIWINIVFGIAYFHIKQNGILKFQKTIPIYKLHYVVVFAVAIGIFYIGILRYKGEFYTHKMYEYKNTNDYIKVISSSKSAQSFAYTIDPVSLPLVWYSGNAYASLGNYESAKNNFKVAYHLNPYNRNVINDLASSFAFTNQIDSAIYYYTEAARISPRFDDPKLNLAAIYIKAGNYKSADFWLKSLLHDSPRRTNYEKIVELNVK